MIHRARIPVLCGAIGQAAMVLKTQAGVRAYGPALIYVLFTGELRGYPDGARVVDLTHVPSPTTNAAWALRDMMEERAMVSIPLAELPAAIADWEQQLKARR